VVLGATLALGLVAMGTESVGAGVGILAALAAVYAWGAR
jgi:hypothetical protein